MEYCKFTIYLGLSYIYIIVLIQIDFEFDLMYPNTGSEFLTTWNPRYTGNIIRAAKAQNKGNLDVLIDGLQDGDSKYHEYC